MKHFRVIVPAILCVLLFSCKTNIKDEKTEISFTEVNNKPDCIIKSDSLKVNIFVKEIINEIKKNKVELLSLKFDYPISMFSFSFQNKKEFIKEWNNNNGELKNYLSIEIYDENDVYIGESNFMNTEIFFSPSKDDKECYKVQFGIGSGLLFDLKKEGEELKVYRLDVAG
jgi:hypothetical protein